MGPRNRCEWASLDDPLYLDYHDKEWGVPVHDDRTLFEFLILEGAQAGLSWGTILRKRENFRRAFDAFDAKKMSRYDERKVARLLGDSGIIRNRLKILSAIKNAKAFLKVQAEFGSFDSYNWRFVGEQRLDRPWFRVRRTDYLLRAYAGHGDGQRPCHIMLSLQGTLGKD